MATISKSNNVKPDAEVIRRHIRILHGENPFTTQVFKKHKLSTAVEKTTRTAVLTDTVIEKIIEDNEKHAEIAIVPNVMDGQGRKAENCVEIKWLFADFDDGKQTLESILELPIKPNLVVQTSPGRFHAYWRITDCQLDQFKPIQKALAEKIGSDPSVVDRARCMRLAGTVNHKHAKSFLAAIVYPPLGKKNTKSRTVAEFCQRFDLTLDLPGAPGGHGDDVPRPTPKENRSFTMAEIGEMLTRIPSDARDTWFKVGAAIHNTWPTTEGYKMWTSWAKRSPKFNAEDQRRTWKGFKPGEGVSLGTIFQLSRAESGGEDVEAALIAAARGNIAFDLRTGIWWRFKGVIWEPSLKDNEPVSFLNNWVKDKQADAEGSGMNWAKFPSVSKIRALVQTLQYDQTFQVDERRFDASPHLLAVKNGVVDLKTGSFRAARPEDWLTCQAGVDYVADSECPKFQAFVRAICDDRKDLGLYLYRALGYTMTGQTSEQVFFLLRGPNAANGKGALMRIMQFVLGSHARVAMPSLLMRASSGNPNSAASALMAIRGTRMVICSEFPEGVKLDEAFVKQFTGGDGLSARDVYGIQKEFTPIGKIWISSNYDPMISIGDQGMLRRLRLIPFDRTFDDNKAGAKVEGEIMTEGSGILSLLIRQAVAYYRDGLRKSSVVSRARDEFLRRADTVKGWVEECCRTESEFLIKSSEAYASYRAYAKELGRPPLGPQAFPRAMAKAGFQKIKRRSNMMFLGLRLLNN